MSKHIHSALNGLSEEAEVRLDAVKNMDLSPAAGTFALRRARYFNQMRQRVNHAGIAPQATAKLPRAGNHFFISDYMLNN